MQMHRLHRLLPNRQDQAYNICADFLPRQQNLVIAI